MEDLHLFDDQPYRKPHLFLVPKVVELKLITTPTERDDTFDNLKCDNQEADKLRAKLFNLPLREEPPDLVA